MGDEEAEEEEAMRCIDVKGCASSVVCMGAMLVMFCSDRYGPMSKAQRHVGASAADVCVVVSERPTISCKL